MVTNNVTVYQFEVGLDEVFADEVRFRVNVDCVIVVVVKDCLFFVSFILCENCEFVKWSGVKWRSEVDGNYVVVVVDPTPPTCCQQSPAPEIMWQPAVSPPRWQGKAPLCRDSSRGPG